MKEPALEIVLRQKGGLTRIAKACGVSLAAVSQWKAVPARHIDVFSRSMGVPAHALKNGQPEGDGAR